MRDPKRINRILTLLQKIWEHQPDVRFNQLVSNLQSLYSQDNNGFGRREVFIKNYIDLEKTSYLDFFYLEDDKWEGFLSSYFASIEQEVMIRREEINEDILAEVIGLFIQAGIENEQITDVFKEKLKVFFVKETRWLTVEGILNVVKNFSKDERQELFEKVRRYL